MSVDVKVAAQRAEARIGSVIKDKWQLDRLLGVGGMACVYAATHRNKKRAAIKMLHRELSSDPGIRERFLREGYLANSVGHRGAVAVDDDDIAEDGSAFIVMELLDGETLEQRCRRKGGRLPLDEVLALADQVLETLAVAHDKGVVHRDLKPENLFLTRDGTVKVLDFGIGRLKELKGMVTTTLTGAAMGTPAFMAPEQARGRWEEVDGQTDLWALGATLFTLLSGEYVHEGETVNETLALACTQPARSLASLRPDLPAAAIRLVDRALSFAKSARHADARAMQAEVRAVYAALAGRDVAEHGQLMVPEAEPSAARGLPPPADSRARQTTARGVSASEQPLALRASLAIKRQPALLGALGLGVLGVVALSLKLCSSSSSVAPAPAVVVSAPEPPASPPVVAAAPPAVTASAAAPSATSSAPPPVPVEALPRERKKKPGALAPAKKDDPFARRR